jgi:hypothetical protein
MPTVPPPQLLLPSLWAECLLACPVPWSARAAGKRNASLAGYFPKPTAVSTRSGPSALSRFCVAETVLMIELSFFDPNFWYRILTPHQQKDARKRLEAGETQRSVVCSYNVSHSTILRLTALLKG